MPKRTVQRRSAETVRPSSLATGVRPFQIQREEDLASAPAQDDAAGVLESYLNQRQIARTVPPAGAGREPDKT